MRWIDRLAYHLWRAVHHLSERPADEPATSDAPDEPAERDMARP
jgi:hypothetical protein